MRIAARFGTLACTLSLVTLFPAGAWSSVADVAPSGFTVTETAAIAAAPERVYAAIVTPSRWWSPEHTYSQSAANLSLDARAGGCWCEALPGGGSVQHLVVVAAIPGKMLRMRGALGPLQAMAVDGAMTLGVHAADGGTQLTLTYVVGGYAKTGFDQVAKAVDSVLAEQTVRLKRFVESGSPESPEHPNSNGVSP